MHEVVAALDAVLIGPSERQTLVPAGPAPSGRRVPWTAPRLGRPFLIVDSSELIEAAGREGALPLEPTLVTLGRAGRRRSPTPPIRAQ